MLFIRNYDKFSLDRSSTSIVDYYRQLLSRLNIDIFNLRNDLTDLLNQVRALRTDLINIKNEIQDILNEDKALAQQLGYTSTEFDAIQGILDAAEEELEDLEKDIESTINRIDCSEIPDACSYTDYTDCSETNEEPTGCGYSCTYDVDACTYCAYGSGVTGSDDDTLCAICNHDACAVDMTCNESCTYNPSDITPGTCNYIETLSPECNETWGTDSRCGEQTCMHYCDHLPIGDECPFTCYHHSSCNELTMPDDCTYTCYDSGCNYNYGCSECDYTSEWCGECDFDDCIFNDDTCTYNPDSGCSYDDNCGFDYNCDEFNCYEDCSEDCGDCGQECGEITCEGGDDYDPSCDECDI